MFTAVSLTMLAMPAAAQGVAQVPEGSPLTLFGLGVLGIVVGRRLASRRSRSRKRD